MLPSHAKLTWMAIRCLSTGSEPMLRRGRHCREVSRWEEASRPYLWRPALLMADEYQPCIARRSRFCVALNQDAVGPIEGDFTLVTPSRCLGHCSWRNRVARRQGRRPMYQAPVGKVRTTRVPQPGTLSRSMRPACRSTMRRASDRPRPTPFGLVVKSGRNARRATRAGIPTPVSSIAISIDPLSVVRLSMRRRPPWGIASMALLRWHCFDGIADDVAEGMGERRATAVNRGQGPFPQRQLNAPAPQIGACAFQALANETVEIELLDRQSRTPRGR